jgi:A/G-specific adenine glycosylase
MRTEAASPVELPTPPWRNNFRRRLLAWYRRHARDLPWRRTRDPYAVWISEVMLQQTQVATVVPYFARFMAAFPTIARLAAAEEQEVLRLWEGLGYYRRARQLHAAARQIVAEHAGRFPEDPTDVARLPGIGRYTAGAILSIAFDQRQPILEANTFRLLARLVAYRGDPQSTAGLKLLWHVAEQLLPTRSAGTFNQALMELGSQVCTPRDPHCGECPARTLCPTRERGLQAVIPRMKPKPRVTLVTEASIVVRRAGKVLLIRRHDHGRWGGLWDFPRFELPEKFTVADAINRHLHGEFGIRVRRLREVATLKHTVTRFRITLACYEADYASGKSKPSANIELRWVAPADLDDYPLSKTGRKRAQSLAD